MNKISNLFNYWHLIFQKTAEDLKQVWFNETIQGISFISINISGFIFLFIFFFK